MCIVLFFIYDLPIFFYYVFLFCTNTCLLTFLHSLLLSNFPHSLHLVCYPKHTHSLQELNPEKESWNIVARVVRLWFVEDYTKGKSSFSMEIVLQDKEVPPNTINAFYFLTFPNFCNFTHKFQYAFIISFMKLFL